MKEEIKKTLLATALERGRLFGPTTTDKYLLEHLGKELFEEFKQLEGQENRDKILILCRGHRICLGCGKQITPYPSRKEQEYCDSVCQHKSESWKEKVRQTNLKRYGVPNSFQSPEVREKAKQTNLKRYGAENVFASEEIKEKLKKINLERYGAEYYTQSKDYKEKIRRTSLEKYGVEHPTQSKEHQEKRKKTCLKKYGVENPLESPEIREKAKQTCLKKYGVEYPLQSPEIQGVYRQNFSKRHNVAYPLQDPAIREKAKQTCLKNHGVENPLLSPKIQEKIKETNLKKYGVEHIGASLEIQEKIKETSMKRYGVEYAMQCPKIKKKSHDGLEKKRIEYAKALAVQYGINPDEVNFGLYPKREYSKDLFLFYMGDMSKTQALFDEYFFTTAYKKLRQLGISKERITLNQLLLIENLEKLGVKYAVNDRKIIPPKEIDIFLPDYNIGIELNGNYWHSEKFKKTNFHKEKSELCKEKNILLLHWFEYVKPEKFLKFVENKITEPKKIDARKCEVRKIENSVANDFCEENHIQGKIGARESFGLFHNNELVMVCTFGKPRFNQKYDWELLRMCSLHGTRIRGGAGKIMKFARSQINGTIISYSNIHLGYNTVYEKIGFRKIGETEPGYVWTNGARVYTRYQTQKHKLKELLGESFDPEMTENENMTAAKFFKLYDCGMEVFVYE